MVRFLVTAFAFFAGVAMQAQTVSPPVVEYPSASEGSFEVTNNSLSTLYAAIEPKSFTIDADGTARFTPLSPDIHIELSASSIKLPPQQSRTIYYKASAVSYPAWFCMYTELMGRPQPGRMNVGFELPHTVYLLGKGHASRDDIVATHLEVSGGKLTGTLENHGRSVVRVQDIRAGSHHAEDNGFPLLPGGSRGFSVPLREDRPQVVVAKLAGFDARFPVP